MPRNTREWAHRKIRESESNIDWAGTHLQDIINVYEKAHPEITKVLEDAQATLLLTQKILTALRGSF